ncbi:MAG: phosphoribosylglycinamide formyltransferase [Firmicutes bacterium]|nr:phosphoribosylglycinamide formyltransferase [Bacillota bacterium]
MINIAVFASGTGSNYEAIMRFFKDNPHPDIRIALVVCDRSKAKVVHKAFKWQTPTVLVNAGRFETKVDYEKYILTKLKQYEIGFIALAGYMRLIGSTILDEYRGKIINLHPSLLPAFPGIDAVGKALDAGVCLTGVTVHFVDQGMDTGPIIAQQAVVVDEHDTHESLSEKIHTVEHQLYPRILQACALGEIYVNNNRVYGREKIREI